MDSYCNTPQHILHILIRRHYVVPKSSGIVDRDILQHTTSHITLHLDLMTQCSAQKQRDCGWLQHALLLRPAHLSLKYRALCACDNVCARVHAVVSERKEWQAKLACEIHTARANRQSRDSHETVMRQSECGDTQRPNRHLLLCHSR